MCQCSRQAGRHEHVQSGQLLSDGSSQYGLCLNSSIDKSRMKAWNIANSPGDLARILEVSANPAQNYNEERGIISDADEEILLHFPFTEFVKIRAMALIGPGGAESPSTVKMYVNRLDNAIEGGFDSVQNEHPTQLINLVDTSIDDEILYLVEAAKFMGVGSVSLYIPSNFGDVDRTRLLKIAFYGEDTRIPTQRPVVANVVYEVRANPADHKNEAEEKKYDSVVK